MTRSINLSDSILLSEAELGATCQPAAQHDHRQGRARPGCDLDLSPIDKGGAGSDVNLAAGSDILSAARTTTWRSTDCPARRAISKA